MEAEEWR